MILKMQNKDCMLLKPEVQATFSWLSQLINKQQQQQQ